MSRCFPYPPPGYEKNDILDESLVESIKKLQREGEKAKKEKKKEKKREKKEKDKARESGEVGKEKHGHKKRHKDERHQEGKKERDHDKKRKLKTENFEKSNLTEEHGLPVGSQNSSDSTLNSNKRHKPCLPPESCHNSGSIIRIRLPLQRHKDPKILPSKEQPCSSSGRTHNAFGQGTCELASWQGREQGEQHHPCSTSTRNASQEIKNFRLGKEKLGPTTIPVGLPHKAELVPTQSASIQLSREKHSHTTKSVNLSHKAESIPTPSKSTQLSQEKHCPTTKSVNLSHKAESVPTPSTSTQLSKEKHCPTTKSVNLSHKAESVPTPGTSTHRPLPPMVSKFRDLFKNWVPPPMQDECTEFGDETWLFELKQNRNDSVERCKDGNDMLSNEPSTLWPRAHFLPAVDIFALPYASPF